MSTQRASLRWPLGVPTEFVVSRKRRSPDTSGVLQRVLENSARLNYERQHFHELIVPGSDRYCYLSGKSRYQEGSFGIVYKGIDRENQCAVAMKVSKQILQSPIRTDAIYDAVRNEAEILQELLGYPCFVQMLDHFNSGRNHCIIMEALQGNLYDQVVVLQRKFLLNETMDLMQQLLDALALLHDKGIINRDIKMENIFWHNGQLKLCDFNSCTRFSLAVPKKEGKHCPMQTLFNRSIEGILGLPYTSNIDLWSAGDIFFKLITGERIFLPRERFPDTPDSEKELLLEIMQLKGEIPKEILQEGKRTNLFFGFNKREGKYEIKAYFNSSLRADSIKERIFRAARRRQILQGNEEKLRKIAEFIDSLISYKRPSVKEAQETFRSIASKDVTLEISYSKQHEKNLTFYISKRSFDPNIRCDNFTSVTSSGKYTLPYSKDGYIVSGFDDNTGKRVCHLAVIPSSQFYKLELDKYLKIS